MSKKNIVKRSEASRVFSARLSVPTYAATNKYLPDVPWRHNEEVDGVDRYDNNRRESHHQTDVFTPGRIPIIHVDQRLVFHQRICKHTLYRGRLL